LLSHQILNKMPSDLHGETIEFLSNSKLIPFP
jgi:hypothetical protein